MKKIAKDKNKVDQKKMYFHMIQSNCIKWLFKKIETLVPKKEALELAGMQWQKAKSDGVLGRILDLHRKFPFVMKKIFNLAIRILRPNKVEVIDKNQKKRVLRMKIKKLAWNNNEKHLHPSQIIYTQRQNKNSLRLVS